MAVYDAFISYSHANDKPIAAALQSAVQKLGKPWYRRRALRVFRDDTSLSATPSLWPSIEQALGQSRYFILLASPEAAASKWVNKEVAHWLDHKGIQTLLIGVTDGQLVWDENVGDFVSSEHMPLPPVLTGRFPSEPKWVDLRAYRNGADRQDAKFTELAADFAAAIHGTPKEDLLSQEVRQQRRALTLAWTAAGSLLILAVAATGAGVLAFRAQQQAIAERDTATRNFKMAHGVADKLVIDVAGSFRNLLGVSTNKVRKTLETAKETFEQLEAPASDDVSLKRSKARMFDEFGQTYKTLGDLKAASKAYHDSLAIRERLAATDHSNTEWQRDLARSYNRVGDLLKQQGKLEEAEKARRNSLAIMERLAANDGNNTEWQSGLSASFDGVGDVLLRKGNLDEALQAYRDGLAIREHLAATDRNNAGWQRDLALSEARIGAALLEQGKLDEAEKTHRDSLATTERLSAADRNNAEWQRDLSVSYHLLADVLAKQGKLEDAERAYRDSLAIMERLAASDLSNTEWQRDLSVSYERIADMLFWQGKLEEAEKARRNSLAIMERLAPTDHSNTEWQRDLARSYNRLGRVLVHQGKLEEAEKAYREGLVIRERLAATDRNNTEWQCDLASSYNDVGVVLEELSQVEEALNFHRKSLAIIEPLAATDRNNTEWQRDLARSYSNIGDVLVKRGHLEEAHKAHQHSLETRITLVAMDRSNAEWKEDLQVSIHFLGQVASRFVLSGDFARALEVAEQAVSLAPDKLWHYINCANALMLLGRVDEARVLYLRYRGEKNVNQNPDGKTWETAILEDFAALRKAGLTHPLMDEIEREFTAGG